MQLYGAHCEGDTGRVVVGGVFTIPGDTILEKLIYINTVDDSLRRWLVFEPRGTPSGSTNILFPPTVPGADVGFIILQPEAAYAMSGSNTMCVVTTLLETGHLKMTEPVTKVVLDTAAGLVTVLCDCENGRVTRVHIENCASFVEHLDHPLLLDGIGEITVDIAYGGCYYALVDAGKLGLEINRDCARALAEYGQTIKEAVDAQITMQHPAIPEINRVDYVMFTQVADASQHIYRNSTVVPPGRLDRSPCGTGSSARMAVMHARGQLHAGEKVQMRSAIDSCFETEIIGTTKVGDRPAILPKISGRAWIFSMETWGVDPTDPFPLGYTLTDTWGPGKVS